MGLGARLLDSIYSHYKGDATVVDVTVEVKKLLSLTNLKYMLQDPSDNFVRLRDFVDAKNCLKLAAFSKDQVNLSKKLCFQIDRWQIVLYAFERWSRVSLRRWLKQLPRN